MIRYPWYRYESTTDTVDASLPLDACLNIRDDGTGNTKHIMITDVTGFGGAIATIADLLAATTQWELIGGAGGAEQGGIIWVLTTAYKIGDVTTEGGDAYISLRDHTSLTGDVADGSPSQPAQTAWQKIGSSSSKTNFTATTDQTDFPVAYTVGGLDVFVGGVKAISTEYTATNGTNVIFHEGIDSDTWVQVIADTSGIPLTTDWIGVSGTPTTVAGYGITDVYTTGMTLTLNDQLITGAKTVTFEGLFDNGTPMANWTLDPMNSQYQTVTLGADNILAITAPAGPCTVYLHIYQDATGGRVLTFPAGNWVAQTPKPVTAAANGHDLMMIHYDGAAFTFDLMQDLG